MLAEIAQEDAASGIDVSPTDALVLLLAAARFGRGSAERLLREIGQVGSPASLARRAWGSWTADLNSAHKAFSVSLRAQQG